MPKENQQKEGNFEEGGPLHKTLQKKKGKGGGGGEERKKKRKKQWATTELLQHRPRPSLTQTAPQRFRPTDHLVRQLPAA